VGFGVPSGVGDGVAVGVTVGIGEFTLGSSRCTGKEDMVSDIAAEASILP